MGYTTYEYYKGTYGGTLDESAFSKFNAVVTAQIDRRIQSFIGWGVVMEAMQERLQQCACYMVDAINVIETENATQPTNKTSEAQDGVSFSYRSPAELQTFREQRIDSICGTWLTYPINLLYGGR